MHKMFGLITIINKCPDELKFDFSDIEELQKVAKNTGLKLPTEFKTTFYDSYSGTIEVEPHLTDKNLYETQENPKVSSDKLYNLSRAVSNDRTKYKLKKMESIIYNLEWGKAVYVMNDDIFNQDLAA